MTRILLLEDDEALARGLVFNLRHENHEVLHVSTVARARDEFGTREPFDLLILDLGLPDGDGLDFLKEITAEGRAIPTLCLSARTSEADVVSALRLGAQDYVRKPFGLAELLARIETILRRAATIPPNDHEEDLGLSATFELGPIAIDLSARTVTREDGEQLPLTPLETELLTWLRARPGEACERRVILEAIWGLGPTASTRTLDNHLARLRRKIELDPAAPRHLLTVHGVGYRFEPQPPDQAGTTS